MGHLPKQGSPAAKGDKMTNPDRTGIKVFQYLQRLQEEFRQLQVLEPLVGSLQHDRMKIVERELSELKAEQPVPAL